MQALDKLYLYLTQIGVDGKCADSYIGIDFSLTPKPPRTVTISGIVSELFPWLPISSPHKNAPDLGEVVYRIRSFAERTPELSDEESKRLAFITGCLEHVKSGRDRHLRTLQQLNTLRVELSDFEPTNPHVQHFDVIEKLYLTSTNPRTWFLESCIKKDLRLVQEEKRQAEKKQTEERQQQVTASQPTDLASINALPSEVLAHITSFLPLRERIAVRLTSSKWAKLPWHDIAASPLYKFFAASKPPQLQFRQALLSNYEYVARIKNIISPSAQRYPFYTVTRDDYHFHFRNNSLYLSGANKYYVIKDDCMHELQKESAEKIVDSCSGFYTIDLINTAYYLKKWDLDSTEVSSYTKVAGSASSTHLHLHNNFLISYEAEQKQVSIQQLNPDGAPPDKVPQSQTICIDSVQRLFFGRCFVKIDNQLAVIDLFDKSLDPKIFLHSQNSQIIGITEQFLLLKSTQGNVLVYNIQTQERLAVIPNKDKSIEMATMDKNILFLHLDNFRKLVVVDIVHKTKIKQFCGDNCRFLPSIDGKIHYGMLESGGIYKIGEIQW